MPSRLRSILACLAVFILCLGATAHAQSQVQTMPQADVVSFREFTPLLTAIALPGYTAGKPTGATMKQPIANSEAQIVLENGDKRVEVSIYDGPGSAGMIASMQGMIEIETSEESIKSVSLKGFRGFEVIRAEQQEVEFMMGVAGRFTVIVRASGKDIEADAKKALESLDMAKLASMAKK